MLKHYPYPKLSLTMGNGEEKYTRKFYIDSGGLTMVEMPVAEKLGLEVKKAYVQGGLQFYKMKGKIRVSCGDYKTCLVNTLVLKDINFLGGRTLMRTIINMKDWTITFIKNNGNITIPFLKN